MSQKTQLAARIAIIFVAVLSIAAGIPKVLQSGQELAFLSALGFTGSAVAVLGVFQCAGGALLLWPRLLVPASVIAGLALLVSSIALLVGGNVPFGVFSLLPLVFLTVAVAIRRRTGVPNAA